MKKFMFILTAIFFISIAFSCNGENNSEDSNKSRGSEDNNNNNNTTTTIGSLGPNFIRPADPYNVKVTPSKVKRGDIITITYDMERASSMPWKWSVDNNWIDDTIVNTDGKLKYIGNGSYSVLDAGIWSINEPVNVSSAWSIDEYVSRKGVSFSRSNTYPSYISFNAKKYVSFKWGEIKCYVPDNASSGKIGISFYYSAAVSDLDLIVVDDNDNEIWYEYATPPDPYNIKFTPSKVKRGDIITVTYDMDTTNNIPNYNWINETIVNANGKLEYTGNDDLFLDGLYRYTGINESLTFPSKTYKFKESIYPQSCTYPSKYISFKWGEIKCYVSDYAVSGKISLLPFYKDYNEATSSDLDLIVVDDYGNEIWEWIVPVGTE